MSYRVWAVLVIVAAFGSPVLGQEGQARPLAPGVLNVITPQPEDGEPLTTPTGIVEVTSIPNLDFTPNYTAKSNTLLAKSSFVVLQRTVWNLEFAFKPLRMVEVDVPQPTGKMQRKLVWYLVYRLRNVGGALRPVQTEGEVGQTNYSIERVNFPTLRSFPHFVLESMEHEKAYLDRVVPAAQKAIQAREDPGVKLLNSIEVGRTDIPLSTDDGGGIWGVATWEDVEPGIDFFSIYIRGLSNAYLFADQPGAYQAGSAPASGRVFQHKTLRLNFWRPGDGVHEHERELRYGMPVDADPVIQQQILEVFGLPERLDYLWLYR